MSEQNIYNDTLLELRDLVYKSFHQKVDYQFKFGDFEIFVRSNPDEHKTTTIRVWENTHQEAPRKMPGKLIFQSTKIANLVKSENSLSFYEADTAYDKPDFTIHTNGEISVHVIASSGGQRSSL